VVAYKMNRFTAGPGPQPPFPAGRMRSIEGLLETSHGLGIVSTMALPCDACANGGIYGVH
jgi:hypothetical protein